MARCIYLGDLGYPGTRFRATPNPGIQAVASVYILVIFLLDNGISQELPLVYTRSGIDQ